MTSTIFTALGGLGLFLLGMMIMTRGLQALAGKAIRSALMRFTRSPLSGAATGAATTAILQSSSATTVAAVGFVGAGLLTFSEALGIILGANVGTTMTGWLVALLGFKLKLGEVALPLVFLGALMSLFAKGRWAQIGNALCGFALIFIGITTMQEGMSGLDFALTPESLPQRTFLGALQLLLIGIVFTVITQSSSAGVAAVLTALHIEAISFEQAAVLVIGMDIGTTITAVMATIGGSINSRRTGYSHVIYNLFTGFAALMLVTPYVLMWETFAPGEIEQNAGVALVAFHSMFNALGVTIVLPFTHQFARFIERIVPDKGPQYGRGLDKALLDYPPLAVNAVQTAVADNARSFLTHLSLILGEDNGQQRIDLRRMQVALDDMQAFLDQVQLDRDEEINWRRLIAMLHAHDHLQRLHERCEEDEERALTARDHEILADVRGVLLVGIAEIQKHLDAQNWAKAKHAAQQVAVAVQDSVSSIRQGVVTKIAEDTLTIPDGTAELEAIRWLKRVSHHISRILYHLNEAVLEAGADS